MKLSLVQNLITDGILDEEQLAECQQIERETGQPLDRILVSKGYVTEANLLQLLGKALRISVREDLDAVDAILRQASQGWDDAAIWQAAFSVVSDELPALTESWSEAGHRDLARNLLEEVRSVIAASTWRQHRRYVVDQRWTFDRVGLLTARLLNALDEMQVYDVLVRHLPEMGVHFAAIASFEPEGEDSVASGHLRMVTVEW